MRRIIQNEVYKPVGEREVGRHYRIDKESSDDKHMIVTDKQNKTVFYGIRGTTGLSEAKLGALLLLEKVANTKQISDSIDSEFRPYLDKYDKIRRLYPDYRVVIGAHSLGGSVAKEILRTHPDDQNVSAKGYASWINDSYEPEGRWTSESLRGDPISEIGSSEEKYSNYSTAGLTALGAVLAKTTVSSNIKKAGVEMLKKLASQDKRLADTVHYLVEEAKLDPFAHTDMTFDAGLDFLESQDRVETLYARKYVRASTIKKAEEQLANDLVKFSERLKHDYRFQEQLASHLDEAPVLIADEFEVIRDEFRAGTGEATMAEYSTLSMRDAKQMAKSARLTWGYKAMNLAGKILSNPLVEFIGFLDLVRGSIKAIHGSENFPPRKEIRKSMMGIDKIRQKTLKRHISERAIDF
jgi:pimeloyl-ACP methyl ester carboxylesterase